MTEKDRQCLINIAKDFLEKSICVDLGTRMPNGIELAGAYAKLVETARSYYIEEAISLRLISSRSDKEAVAIFDNAVDDYVFGKILDQLSQVQRKPAKTPMELIFGSDKVSP